MRTAAFLGFVALLPLFAGTPQTPDLSGRWALDWTSIEVPRGATGPGTGPGRVAPAGGSLGEEFIATQTASSLTIEYQHRNRLVTLAYKLDGSESRNRRNGRPEAQEEPSKAAWDQGKLVIVTTTTYGTQKRTLSLKDGYLVLDIEEPIPDAPPIRSSIRYKRVK